MDDIVSARPVRSKTISEAEMRRRLQFVRPADANNRLKGIFREAETDAGVEAFMRGDIKATDMVSLFKAHPEPC